MLLRLLLALAVLAAVSNAQCLDEGFYLNANTKTCYSCEQGYYCPSNTSARLPCPPGSYQNMQAQASCIPCAATTFQDLSGQQTCKPCNTTATLGRTSLVAGSTSCPACLEDYYLDGTACKFRGAACDPATQYEVPSNTTRTCRALKPCDTSKKGSYSLAPGLPPIQVLNAYISKYQTQFADRECWNFSACPEGSFALQQLEVDERTAFIIKPLLCKPYRPCQPNVEYTLLDGSLYGDRDYICAAYTQCKTGLEYEAKAITTTSDRVCKTITTCDAAYQYVLQEATPLRDRICGTKTRCTAQSFRSMYEAVPAMDAPSIYKNGSDAVCKNYTVCKQGFEIDIPGNDTADHTCRACPLGTFSDPSRGVFQCTMCPEGTYTNRTGSVSCVPCRSCRSYSQLCSPMRDASCSANDTCPSGWDLNPTTGLCSMCARGYLNVSNRCVPCYANFFCESLSTFEVCQDIRMFLRDNAFVVVPSSPAGSYHPSSCSCSTAGGFEGTSGLFGCTPCKDGYYSSPGMTSCQKCPNGTYASAKTNQRDYLRFPNSTSPRLAITSAVAVDVNNFLITVGAASCTPCPADRPYTWKDGATSVADCRACPVEYYLDSTTKKCTKCRSPCAAPSLYETVPCTLTTNRQCAACNRECRLVDEYATTECVNGRGCAKCNSKPPNSHYVLGLSECAWACDSGFYSDAVFDECRPCTQLNATTCPAGYVFRACSDELGRDASCDEPCSSDNKPLDNSEWILTTMDADGQLIPSSDARFPNIGCMWRCSDGYKEQKLEMAGFSICVRDS